MFTKDSSFYNFCGIVEPKSKIIEYKKSLMREQYIKLNKNTNVDENRSSHHSI